jgi:hypothetical protein
MSSDQASNRRDIIERLLDDAPPVRWSETTAYRKWQGAHWRLVSLVELGERDDPRMGAMLDHVLSWLLSPGHLRGVEVLNGRARRCASQEGNALFVAAMMGRIDPADELASNLITWQWPDGGRNCDRRPATTHSSFHETVWPLRGLAAYHDATGEGSAFDAARRAGEFLLSHRLFRSERTEEVIDDEWLKLHWPPYWRYDVLQGLRAVASLGCLGRDEAAEALDWLRSQESSDGSWNVSGRRWWRNPGSRGNGVEVVDWSPLADAIITQQARGLLVDLALG